MSVGNWKKPANRFSADLAMCRWQIACQQRQRALPISNQSFGNFWFTCFLKGHKPKSLSRCFSNWLINNFSDESPATLAILLLTLQCEQLHMLYLNYITYLVEKISWNRLFINSQSTRSQVIKWHEFARFEKITSAFLQNKFCYSIVYQVNASWSTVFENWHMVFLTQSNLHEF